MSNNLLELDLQNKDAAAVASPYENINDRKEIYLKYLILSSLKEKNPLVEIAQSLFYGRRFYALTRLFDFYVNNNVFDLIILKPNSDEMLFNVLHDDIHSNIYGYVVARISEDFKNAEILGYFMSKDFSKTVYDKKVNLSKLKDLNGFEDIEILDSQMSLEDVSERFFALMSGFMDEDLDEQDLSELACLLYNSEELRSVFADLGRFDRVCMDVQNNSDLLEDDFLSILGGSVDESLDDLNEEEYLLDDLSALSDNTPEAISPEDIDLGVDLEALSAVTNVMPEPMGSVDETLVLDELISDENVFEQLETQEGLPQFEEIVDGTGLNEVGDLVEDKLSEVDELVVAEEESVEFEAPVAQEDDNLTLDELVPQEEESLVLDEFVVQEDDTLTLDELVPQEEDFVLEESAEDVLNEQVMEESSEILTQEANDDEFLIEEDDLLEEVSLEDLSDISVSLDNEDAMNVLISQAVSDAKMSVLEDGIQENPDEHKTSDIEESEDDGLLELSFEDGDENLTAISDETVIKSDSPIYSLPTPDNGVDTDDYELELKFEEVEEVVDSQSDFQVSSEEEIIDDELMELLGTDVPSVPVNDAEVMSILGVEYSGMSENSIKGASVSTAQGTSKGEAMLNSVADDMPPDEDRHEELFDVLYTEENTSATTGFPGEGIVSGNILKKSSAPKNRFLLLVAVLVVLAGAGLSYAVFGNKIGTTGMDFAKDKTSFDDNNYAALPPVLDDNKVVPAPVVPAVSPAAIEPLAQDTKIESSLSKQAGAAPVILRSVAWQIPASISNDAIFSKYLQIAGKNIKMNLASDLLDTDDFAYNNKIKISMTVKNNTPVKNIKVLESSGSKSVDDIVLQSIKQTLKYINTPVMSSDIGDREVILVISI